MKNHGLLRTHNDKMCAEISMGKNPNTPQLIWPICPNWPFIWDISEKNPLHMCIVRDLIYQNYWTQVILNEI